MNTTFTEEDLIVRKDVRDSSIDRTGVLEKVKTLLLIPSFESATSQMVADFYEVDKTVIEKLTLRNRSELDSDGLKLTTKREILNGHHVRVENFSYHIEIALQDGSVAKISNRGVLLYPRRAILRVGMLLRDSNVAREVRTQLLNIEGRIAPEEKTVTLDVELMLQNNIDVALKSGDATKIANAYKTLANFHKDKIAGLQEEKKQMEQRSVETLNEFRGAHNALAAVTKELNIPTPKEVAKRLINWYAFKSGSYTGVSWNIAYGILLRSHGVNVKSRQTKANSKAPLMSFLSADELLTLVSVIVTMCETRGYPTDKIMKDAEYELPEIGDEAMSEFLHKWCGGNDHRKFLFLPSQKGK